MVARGEGTPGFDQLPERHIALTAVLFICTVGLATTFAVAFKESGVWVIEQYGGSTDAVRAATDLHPLVVGLVVTGAVAAAAMLGRVAELRWPARSGIEAVAARARGEDRRISLRASMTRAGGTFLCLGGMASIGRESAIIECGGAFGSSLATRYRGHGATMATAGIAAAFATAYHAPIAAVVYLGEHLRVGSSRRAVIFTIAGAASGFTLSRYLFRSEELLPRLEGDWESWALAAAVAVFPGSLSGRVTRELRVRAQTRADRRHRADDWWLRVAVAAVIAGAAVAVAPTIAGNGLDALREVALTPQLAIGVALAMSITKLVGTTASFAAGAPGGALTPTMTVAAGTALLLAVGAQDWLPDSVDPWSVAVFAATAALAIGVHSPFTAVFLLPEMMGQMSVIPIVALVAGAAVVIDRLLDRVISRLPTVILDIDG